MKYLFVLLLSCTVAFGQGSPLVSNPWVANQNGQPVANVLVAVCTTNPGTGVCPSLATIYTDATLSHSCTGSQQLLNNVTNPSVGSGCSNPGFTDGLGNVVAFSGAGNLWCQFSGPSIATYSQPCIFPSLIVTPNSFPGGDIGAQVNAAISYIVCGEVYIPAGTYTQTTTIVVPRCVKLHGASGYGTTLAWSSTTGWPIVIADGRGAANYPPGALEDIAMTGPGSGTSSGGIYIGGSDGQAGSPSVGIDPGTNYGDMVSVNRVRVYQFGTGIQWGNNAWKTTIFESVVTNCGTGVFFPATVTNSGESLSISKSIIQNNAGIGVKVGNTGQVNLNIDHTSIDANVSWAIQNGTSPGQQQVNCNGCVIVQHDHWIQNFGVLSVNSPDFTDGNNSGTLGYLIDNEQAAASFSDGQMNNGGGGVILNSAGACSVWKDVLITGNGTSLASSCANIDRFGNAGFAAIFAVGDPNHFGTAENLQSYGCETSYGETTLSTSGTITNTGQNCLPANAVIDAVLYRVTVTISGGGVTGFSVGDGSTVGRFCNTQSGLTAGTTGICIAQSGTSGQQQVSAAPVRITTNLTPTQGHIRLIVYAHTWTPPII